MAITGEVVLETVTSAFNAQDLSELWGLLADDVVFRAPGGIEGVGRTACIEFYRRWLEDFPDAHLDVDTTHIVDDVAVEHGTFTGTHNGVGRTGRTVAVDFVQLFRFRDGKFASVKLFFDRLLMLEQLGLVGDVGCAA